MDEYSQDMSALAGQQGGSPCDVAHEVHRAGVVTCVVFPPVKTFSAVAEAVGGPAPFLGLWEEKRSSIMSLSSSALLWSSM